MRFECYLSDYLARQDQISVSLVGMPARLREHFPSAESGIQQLVHVQVLLEVEADNLLY